MIQGKTEEMLPTATLNEARAAVREAWIRGINCPCCGQNVKLQQRVIYGRMARDLIRLYRKPNSSVEFYHRENFEAPKAGGGDFHKLQYWGLAEPMPNNDDKTKRTNGFWRITQQGIAFVENRMSVPKYAYVYNGKARKLEGDDWSIREALGKKFSYEDLMGNAQ